MDSAQVVEEKSASSSKSEFVFCEECAHFDESKIVFPPLWRCFHSSNQLSHPIKRKGAILILSANKKNVAVLESGPHKKLVCQDCYSFIKFLSGAEYKIYLALQEKKAKESNGNH